MKRIAVEEHFSTPDYYNFMSTRADFPKMGVAQDKQGNSIPAIWLKSDFFMPMNPYFGERLTNLELRLKEMDEDGIDVQILSVSVPGPDEFDAATGTSWAKKLNNALYKITKNYPDRFVGLAALAPQDPAGAANELERTVKDYGFKGAKLNSNIHGEYLDEERYWILLERAEKLGVPLYIHPKFPSYDILRPFKRYPALTGSMWGFSVDAGLHAMRLICGGIFDKFPGLTIVLGHLGEALPFWLWRMDNRWETGEFSQISKDLKLRRKPSDYVKQNFYVTTSGNFWETSFMCARAALGIDRIMFAVDYPFEPNKPAVKFMEALPISDAEKKKVYQTNAEKVFGLKASSKKQQR